MTRMAWYKPFHEPSMDQITVTPDEGFKYLDLHDLKELRSFWRSELAHEEAVTGIHGAMARPLDRDHQLTVGKLARLNTEIRRREAEGEI